MRLALITNIPSPYRLPVWDALGQKVDSLHVFLCSNTEPNRIWQSESLEKFSFTHTRLSGMHLFIQKLDWAIHFNPALWRELEHYKPTHILLGSYETPSYLLALLYAKWKHIPVTLWWESHAFSSRFQRGILAGFKRQLLHQIDSFCAVSSLSKEFLTNSVGISERKIVRAVNTVDVRRWHGIVTQQRTNHDRTDRPTRCLYVGQFIPRKGVLELLTAFRSIPAEKATLRLVGYGPQEAEIKAYIAKHHMENIELVGLTKTMEQTAQYYSWADVLIMPSLSEVWGLVANEALVSGVYVMASRYAGATRDLIELAPYEVGMSFDPSKTESFIGALVSVLAKRASLDRQAISAWGLKHTPEMYAQSLRDAVSIAAAG